MKKYFFYVFPFLLISLFSCQKEVTDPNMQPETGGGGNTVTGTYLPLTKGTYWKYQDSASGTITTLTVLDKTKIINGQSFTAVLGVNDTQTDTSFMARQNADYFNYVQADNGMSSGSFLFYYLNDTAAVGRTWEYVGGQGNGFPAYFKTTILERNITRTVHNKSYSNVIHTQMELSYDLLGERIDAGTYHYYIAREVGIIQVKSKVGLAGSELAFSSDLIEYQVK